MKKSKKAIAVKNPAALDNIKNQSLSCRFSLKISIQKKFRKVTNKVPTNNPPNKTTPPIHVKV
jgi:hypothetical protein